MCVFFLVHMYEAVHACKCNVCVCVCVGVCARVCMHVCVHACVCGLEFCVMALQRSGFFRGRDGASGCV